MSAESIERTAPETQIAEPEPGCEMPPSEILPSLETSTFSPYFDVALYIKLFPDKTPEQAAQVIPHLNKMIAVGSQPLGVTHGVTLKASKQIPEQRTKFYGWTGRMGLDILADLRSKRDYDIPPGIIVQNIRFIDALYGDDNLLGNIRKSRAILGTSLESLQNAYGHGVRLARVFGWDESVIRQIVRKRPELLHTSRRAQFFYARMMAEHGEKMGISDDPRALLPNNLRNSSPQQKIGRLARLNNDIRRSQPGKHEQQSNFLSALNASKRQEAVGRKVLHAYFRYEPIKNMKLFEHYPNLRQYHLKATRDWETAWVAKPLAEIEADAPWLAIGALEGKHIDLEVLNESAKIGSRQLNYKTPQFKVIKTETMDARKTFVTELGWYDPQHKMYGYACQVDENEKLSWPSPERIIDLITLLSKYTDDPMHCIRVKAKTIFGTTPKNLEEKLIAIKAAFPSVADIKTTVAKNLSSNIAVIYENGARYEQKRAAKAAKE